MQTFFKTIDRNSTEIEIKQKVEQCFAESPMGCLKLMFHLRDCRRGKGLRKPFYTCVRWFVDHGHIDLIRANLDIVPKVGYWKDLLHFLDTPLQKDIIELFANKLTTDQLNMFQNMPTSLCAKYAPTEGCCFDKKYKIVSKLANAMGVTKRQYRKDFVGPLREYLKVAECRMCDLQFGKIAYSKVPSLCLLRNQETFYRNDCGRFENFLQNDTEKAHLGRLHLSQILKELSCPELTDLRINYLDKTLKGKKLQGIVVLVEPTQSNCKLAKEISRYMADNFEKQIVISNTDGNVYLTLSDNICIEKLPRIDRVDVPKVWSYIDEKCHQFGVPENLRPQFLVIISNHFKYHGSDNRVICVNDVNENTFDFTSHQQILKQYQNIVRNS